MHVNDMKFCLLFLYLTLFSVARAQNTIQVKDMIGRTVTVPAKIDSVYASGHSKSVVATFIAEKIPGGVAYSDEQKALLPETWWGNRPMSRRSSPPKPGEGTSGRSGNGTGRIPPGVLNDSMRIRHLIKQLEGSHTSVAIFETDHFTGKIADALLEQTGIPVVIIDLSVYRLKELYALLGEIFSREQQAEMLIDFVTKYIDPIGEKVKSIPEGDRVHFYYAEGNDGLRTEPSGSFHTMAIEFAGGINVIKAEAGTPVERSVQITLEKLRSSDPDVILVSTPGSENLSVYSTICTNEEWNGFSAVKNRKIYQIQRLPFSWIDRPPGANRMLGVVWIANLFYPDLFPFDMIKVSQEFFRVFYHTNLSDEQAKSLLTIQPDPVLSLSNFKNN